MKNDENTFKLSTQHRSSGTCDQLEALVNFLLLFDLPAGYEITSSGTSLQVQLN
jgi:hypothetical protein